METMELHRGRLIDHIQLVVRDLDASRAFYRAVFAALQVPMGGDEASYFWADELFVSTADSAAARRTASTMIATPARSSATPQPYRRPLAMVPAKGGYFQSFSVPS